MDREGPEHHYDEIESPENGRSILWQQGEVAPDHVNNNGGFYGEGRPYRGQPNPVEDEMDRYRDMPLDGYSPDEGGNQFRTDKGILASKKDDEDLEQLDEATEPKGLGEFDPVKDNDWPAGDISSRPARDEMLGSVKKSNDDSWDELWDEVVDECKDVDGSKTNDDEHQKEDPMDKSSNQMNWEVVEVLEPPREHIETANKYTMPLPNGITDAVHKALIQTNAWVENPEENGKLRPYKQYWSVIRPKINEGNIQIGVESPNMADIINHVARTGDLSALDKSSSVQKESFLPALAAIPAGLAAALEAVGGAAGLAAIAGRVAPWIGRALAVNQAGDILTGGDDEKSGNGSSESKKDQGALNQLLDTITPDIPMPDATTLDRSAPTLSKRLATYGDSFDHPSSITRRIEEVVNGGIDPHQRTDESNDDWGYDMLDVNEIGQSKDIRGTDDAQNRIISSLDHQDHLDIKEIVQKIIDTLPKVFEYAFSDASGTEDPDIMSLHEELESLVPNYLESAKDDDLMLLFTDTDLYKDGEKLASGPGFDKGPGFDGVATPIAPDPTMMNKPKKPNVTDPSTRGVDPQTAPANAAGNTPGWDTQTSPNLVNNSQPLTPQEQQQSNQMAQKQKQQEQQNQQQIMQQMQKKKQGSKTQGPHTDEQQAAVAELLIEQGRENEIPNMLSDEGRVEYDEELAAIQKKQPVFGEDPRDMDRGPEAGGPPNAPAGVPPEGMTPEPNQGMPSGTPPMQAPTPGDLNPAGPGAMQPPAMQALGSKVNHDVNIDMLNSVLKYATDSVCPPCPKCKSHTTEIVNQKANDDGSLSCKCKNCNNQWTTDAVSTADGKSSDLSSTAKYHQSVMDSFAERVEDVDEDIVDDSSHTWTDENGEPLQEGKEYEIYAHNYEIPDVGRVVEIKPDAIVYEIESDGGLRTIIEIDRKEADLNGYRFAPTANDSDESLDDGTFGIEDKIAPEPGQTTDLSTPHREIGASAKEATVTYYMCPVPNCPNNSGGGDYEPGVCSIHNAQLVPAGQEAPANQEKSAHKIAGKHYTPMEQRELIDEYGEARNADKLNLEGTHYADTEDDYFLFGC